MPTGLDVQPGHVGAETPYAQRGAYSASTFHDGPTIYNEQTAAEVGQMPSPSSGNEYAFSAPSPNMAQSMPPQTPLQQGWSPATPFQTTSQSSGWTPTQGSSHPFPQEKYTPGNRQGSQRTTRIGFALAGICLIGGALILVYVTIMAQALLPSGNSPSQAAQMNTGNTPSAANTSLPTKVAPTPTEIFPGAQYINNARMASKVNEITAHPLQYATDFKMHQKIYVTFTVNTGAQDGAFCVRWYMNNQYTGHHYENALSKNLSYSTFASYFPNWTYTPGPGYVEVYWASTVACTDGLLARRVSFTIT